MPRTTRPHRRRVVMAAVAVCVVITALAASAGTAVAEGTPHGSHRTLGPSFGMHHGPTLKGTVAADPAPSSTAFTLDAPGCATPVTVTLTGSTTFAAPPTGVTPTGVSSGERVVVSLEPGASGVVARSVTILLAQISGVVADAGPSALVVVDGQGFHRTIDVSSATVYRPTQTPVVPPAVGQWVDAFGDIDADHVTLDAVVVRSRTVSAHPVALSPGTHGPIVGVVAAAPAPGPTGFTLTEGDGTTQAVATTTSTSYVDNGIGSTSGVAAGEHVAVFRTTGSVPLTARKVVIFLDQLDGTIVSTGTSSLVLADHEGFWRTIDVAGSTTALPSGTVLGTLAAGDHVVAYGTVDADTVSLDALVVRVFTWPPASSADQQAWQRAPSTCPSNFVTPAVAGDDPAPPTSWTRGAPNATAVLHPAVSGTTADAHGHGSGGSQPGTAFDPSGGAPSGGHGWGRTTAVQAPGSAAGQGARAAPAHPGPAVEVTGRDALGVHPLV